MYFKNISSENVEVNSLEIERIFRNTIELLRTFLDKIFELDKLKESNPDEKIVLDFLMTIDRYVTSVLNEIISISTKNAATYSELNCHDSVILIPGTYPSFNPVSQCPVALTLSVPNFGKNVDERILMAFDPFDKVWFLLKDDNGRLPMIHWKMDAITKAFNLNKYDYDKFMNVGQSQPLKPMFPTVLDSSGIPIKLAGNEGMDDLVRTIGKDIPVRYTRGEINMEPLKLAPVQITCSVDETRIIDDRCVVISDDLFRKFLQLDSKSTLRDCKALVHLNNYKLSCRRSYPEDNEFKLFSIQNVIESGDGLENVVLFSKEAYIELEGAGQLSATIVRTKDKSVTTIPYNDDCVRAMFIRDDRDVKGKNDVFISEGLLLKYFKFGTDCNSSDLQVFVKINKCNLVFLTNAGEFVGSLKISSVIPDQDLVGSLGNHKVVIHSKHYYQYDLSGREVVVKIVRDDS